MSGDGLTLTRKKLLNSGILEEYHTLCFEDYKGNSEVKEEVRQYMSHLANAKKEGISLFLHGVNGVGKTFLGAEVLKQALREGYSAQMVSLSGIIQMYSDGWYSTLRREAYDDRVKNVDFLMIDDVGKEFRSSKSGLTEIAFDNLIRYRTLRNKPMIITTNSSIEAIENVYGKSLVSLLYGKFIPIRVLGEDYRKTNLSKTVKQRLLATD